MPIYKSDIMESVPKVAGKVSVQSATTRAMTAVTANCVKESRIGSFFSVKILIATICAAKANPHKRESMSPIFMENPECRDKRPIPAMHINAAIMLYVSGFSLLTNQYRNGTTTT